MNHKNDLKYFKNRVNPRKSGMPALLDKKYAIPLCKFRAGNNKLPIVTGRHENTPRNMHFCLLCPDRKLGDEYHYIFECTHFNEKRSQLIDRRFLNDRSDIAMCSLFNTLDVNQLKKLRLLFTSSWTHVHDCK